MKRLIVILLLPTSLFMRNSRKELNIADLFQCVGANFSQQKAFDGSAVVDASNRDKEKYFPILIEKLIKNPQQFSLFGIPADEIYFALDSQQTTVGVFIRLDNQDLITKLASAIPGEYIAAGLNEEPSYYLWEYKGGCVGLELAKYQTRFIPKIVRDEGLIIFFNCNILSYMASPKSHE